MLSSSLVAVYGILVPQPGMQLEPTALGTQSLIHWTSSEVPPSSNLFELEELVFSAICLARGGPFSNLPKGVLYVMDGSAW